MAGVVADATGHKAVPEPYLHGAVVYAESGRVLGGRQPARCPQALLEAFEAVGAAHPFDRVGRERGAGPGLGAAFVEAIRLCITQRSLPSVTRPIDSILDLD